MTQRGAVLLVEFLLASFFAIACIKAHGSFSLEKKPSFREFFYLSDRIERLRRSRWQWFSMVAIMLVLRLQNQLPLAIEIMVGTMFLIFLVFPVQTIVRARG
jgi:hypothetical protein